MTSPTPFLLPADIRLTVVEGRICVTHTGDVRLEQSLGRPLGEVDAAGDLTVAMPRIEGRLRSKQTLTCQGEVRADVLEAQRIRLEGPRCHARVVKATEWVEIGPTVLDVDVISAPEIRISPEASGKVTILDCSHEVPQTRVRGCMTVAAYGELVGNVASFLAERDVTPVGPWPAEGRTSPAVIDDEEADDTAVTAAPAAVVVTFDDADAPIKHSHPSVYIRIRRSMERILHAYPGPHPTPIRDLIECVRTGDAKALVMQIDVLWTALLRHHIAAQRSVDRSVIQAFFGIRAATFQLD